MSRSSADQIVIEMEALGARFTIVDDVRWTWAPHPEDMRSAIRKVWRGADCRPGDADMVAAIRRFQRGDGA